MCRWAFENVWDCDRGDPTFPMYTMPAKVLLQLTEMKMHEELIQAGALAKFEDSMGKAMFVSHQWLSDTNPDPRFEQLPVLQSTLVNITAGTSRVHVPLVTELLHGRLPCPGASDFNLTRLHIWYDYFCCPQGSLPFAEKNRQRAIESIPAYVARCEFFVILCPALKHLDSGRTLSQATWGERGWCRTERVARELAARKGGYMIVVESPTLQTLIWEGNRLRDAPGSGRFTRDADRAKIGRMMVKMVWTKLSYYLQQQDLHNYRLLLNSQKSRFFRDTDVEPVSGLLPGLGGSTDPTVDPKLFVMERFLHENRFGSVNVRDAGGWSPLCFAALFGDPVVVEALLENRAEVNDATTKPKRELHFPKLMSALGIAAAYCNNEALETLLSFGAIVNNKDGFGGNALHHACFGDNPLAVRRLCLARADPSQGRGGIPGADPFLVACCCGSALALRELLNQVPNQSLRHGLHMALITNGGGSTDTISALLQAKADANERFKTNAQESALWLLFKIMGCRHRVSPSRLTSLAYHHHGATPLMFSVLSGYFEATAVLLAAGARVDIKNYRNKTVCDLAPHMLAPVWLIQALSAAAQPSRDLQDSDDDTFFI